MNYLGIDFETTSVKAVLFDEKLRELASSTEDYTLKTADNTVELDPLKYWDLLQNALCTVRAKAPVDCLAIDTQCDTLILTDENGTPVRDAIVWLDNRATEETESINERFGRQKVYEVTGQLEITATWPACKLLWVRRNEPEVWARTKKIFLLEDYLLYKLTGKFVTEKPLQSSTIYFDINRSVWWEEMLSFIGITKEQLPVLMDSGKYVVEYDGMKVVTSAMDQVAGAIGAGVTQKGIVREMTGKHLTTLKNKETACLGSAILAGVGAGVFPSVKDACRLIETAETYLPTGTDYSETCSRFDHYDTILNVRGE